MVHVEWMDAALTPGWIEMHDEADVIPVDTIGYLWYEDKRVIKLAQTISSSGHYSAVHTIPKSTVIKITRLHKK